VRQVDTARRLETHLPLRIAPTPGVDCRLSKLASDALAQRKADTQELGPFDERPLRPAQLRGSQRFGQREHTLGSCAGTVPHNSNPRRYKL